MDHSRQGDDGIIWFVSETPHFCKVILPETLQRRKLLIPKNFIHKHGNLLSDEVFLQVPNGKTWQAELDKSNEQEDMVWMSRGWSDFVKYYSVDSFFFVVFRSEGNSKFNVMIFDTTMLEIDYPRNSVGRNRANVDANDNGEFLSPKIEEDDDDDVYAGKSGQFSDQTRKIAQMHRHRSTESSLRARALEAASRFGSTSPFFQVVFFKVKMNAYLLLPNDFVKNNIEEKRTRWVALKVLHRSHSWRVKMQCQLVDSDFKEARFCAGWSAFRTQVPLHHHDVCNFKLVNQKDMVFHVFVLRDDTLLQ